MAQAGSIEVRVDGHVAHVTIDNPSRRNAVGYAMWCQLAEAFDAIASDERVRVVRLAGAGEQAFSAGADIKEFDEWRSEPTRAARYAEAASGGTDAVARCPKPVISVVRGACVGGGFELALLGDIRLCSASAWFAVTPARLGLGYDLHDTVLLVDRLGASATREILLTGRRFDAREALRLGIVNRVVDDDALDAIADEYLATIAANAPLSVRASKAIIAEAARPAGQRDEALCTRLVDACYASEDYAEGRAAFAAKRTPRFHGR